MIADKPFFVYYAPGAAHAPHHVATSWSDKYKGRFDQGWDRIREETFARQRELGVISEDAALTERPAEISAWDDVPDEMKPVLAREMAVYAGFLEHADHNIGRLIEALADLEILDDTLVYLIIGDSGASAGTFNEMLTFNGRLPHRDARVPDGPHRQVRHARGLQPLRRGMGARHGHAVPVDQAGRVPLRRDAQRPHRALATGHPRHGRDPLSFHQ